MSRYGRGPGPSRGRGGEGERRREPEPSAIPVHETSSGKALVLKVASVEEAPLLTAWDGISFSDSWEPRLWERALSAEERDRVVTLLALEPEESSLIPVGFLTLKHHRGKTLVRKLVVIPRAQRLGVASLLLAKAQDLLGEEEMVALVPFEKRFDAACGFFRALGWSGVSAPDGCIEFRSPVQGPPEGSGEMGEFI